MALALWLLGLGVESNAVERSLGGAATTALLECGALVRSLSDRTILLSPVQVYPLRLELRPRSRAGRAPPPPLLVATDWDIESLCPNKYKVMAVGLDSLELAHAAPRHLRRARVLDVCCGSGVQALVAATTYAAEVVALDVNERAVRFCRFNAALNSIPPGRCPCTPLSSERALPPASADPQHPRRYPLLAATRSHSLYTKACV